VDRVGDRRRSSAQRPACLIVSANFSRRSPRSGDVVVSRSPACRWLPGGSARSSHLTSSNLRPRRPGDGHCPGLALPQDSICHRPGCQPPPPRPGARTGTPLSNIFRPIASIAHHGRVRNSSRPAATTALAAGLLRLRPSRDRNEQARWPSRCRPIPPYLHRTSLWAERPPSCLAASPNLTFWYWRGDLAPLLLARSLTISPGSRCGHRLF
jgi:hypothetical protein